MPENVRFMGETIYLGEGLAALWIYDNIQFMLLRSGDNSKSQRQNFSDTFSRLKEKIMLKKVLKVNSDRHWTLIIYVIIYRKCFLKILSSFILVTACVCFTLLWKVSFSQVEGQRWVKLFLGRHANVYLVDISA